MTSRSNGTLYDGATTDLARRVRERRIVAADRFSHGNARRVGEVVLSRMLFSRARDRAN